MYTKDEEGIGILLNDPTSAQARQSADDMEPRDAAYRAFLNVIISYTNNY